LALHRVYTFVCAYKSFQQGTCFFIVGHSNNIFVCDDVGNVMSCSEIKDLILSEIQQWSVRVLTTSGHLYTFDDFKNTLIDWQMMD
jgi:hypothetical protein